MAVARFGAATPRPGRKRAARSSRSSAAEQQEAERRVSAAIAAGLDKSAPLKEFYGKIKAGAATVQMTRLGQRDARR